MQMSSADKQAFVNALDQAKRTVHPDLVICTRRCVVQKKNHKKTKQNTMMLFMSNKFKESRLGVVKLGIF